MVYRAYCGGKEISNFYIGGKRTSEIWGGNTLLWNNAENFKKYLADRQPGTTILFTKANSKADLGYYHYYKCLDNSLYAQGITIRYPSTEDYDKGVRLCKRGTGDYFYSIAIIGDFTSQVYIDGSLCYKIKVVVNTPYTFGSAKASDGIHGETMYETLTYDASEGLQSTGKYENAIKTNPLPVLKSSGDGFYVGEGGILVNFDKGYFINEDYIFNNFTKHKQYFSSMGTALCEFSLEDAHVFSLDITEDDELEEYENFYKTAKEKLKRGY